MRYRRDLFVATAVLALIPAARAAAAEELAVSSLEEVVVTATRREVRLRDVPLSVTAISQEKLTARGIVGYEGLALRVVAFYRDEEGYIDNIGTGQKNSNTLVD